jgi:hypothetical protein
MCLINTHYKTIKNFGLQNSFSFSITALFRLNFVLYKIFKKFVYFISNLGYQWGLRENLLLFYLFMNHYIHIRGLRELNGLRIYIEYRRFYHNTKIFHDNLNN